MNYIIILLFIIASSCSFALGEESPLAANDDIQFYLYEQDPGELFWEAERQADLGNLQKARELFIQSCKAGIGGSCAVLGSMFQKGEGGEEDIEKGCNYFRQACEMGYVQSCAVVAYLLEGDLCGPPNFSESRRLYSIACDIGDFSACGGLGRLLEYGHGGEKDTQSARQYYRRACEGEFQDGCAQYGRSLISGIGGNVDIGAAKRILKKSCAASEGKSCYQLAVLLEDETSPSENAEEYFCEAREIFRTTCARFRENEDIEACYIYSFLVATGRGGPKNVTYSLRFLKAACAEGHQPSCKTASELEAAREN